LSAGDATPTIQIRPARPDDRNRIVAFNARLAEETESKMLDRPVLERGVESALAEPDRLRYWIAERDGQIAGQAAITREWSDWRNGWIWWLQSVYVDAPHRGSGVFRCLYEQIRSEALREPGVIGLRLYVEHGNRRAQDAYRRLGMSPGGYEVFEELWLDRFGG
jgi:GNAT superfamily N-acetyltransferase